MYQSGSGQANGGYYSSRSPPPLQHPIPTHPPFQVPDPPVTPNLPSAGTSSVDASPADPHVSYAHPRGGNTRGISGLADGGYQRFSSPPLHAPGAQQQFRGGGGPGAAYSGGPSSNDPYGASSPLGGHQQGSQHFYSGAGQHMASGNMAGGQPGANAAGNIGVPWPGFGGGNVMNDATAQMGVQFGRHVAQVGGEYMERNFNALLPVPVLKHYFNVSNSYVLHKLRLVLFPWRHKPWSRAQRHGAASYPGMGADPNSSAGAQGKGGATSGEGFLPPREDVNSPDLYIPVMAFVTYTLLTSTIHGLESRFHPEVLGVTASKALAVILIEFSAVKLGCYLLNIQGDHTMVDLVAYSGYKFVGVICTLLAGLFKFSRLVYWGVFLYTFAANAFFLLRSLRYVVLPDPSSPSSVTITHAQRGRRIQFLFAIAVAQIVFSWLLIVGIFN